MPEQNRPASKELAPDPSDNYERSHPEHEAGMGRLDNNTRATPRHSPDHVADAVKNTQDGSKQINAHEEMESGGKSVSQPHHTTKQDPVGWDSKSAKK